MKKSSFIIPLALAFVLTGCAGGEVSSASSSSNDSASSSSAASSSSSASSSESSSSSSSSSESSSSSSSSSSSEDENVKKDLTIDDLKTKATAFAAKKSAVASGTVSKSYTTVSDITSGVTTYEYGSDSNGEAVRINDGYNNTNLTVLHDSDGKLVTVSGKSADEYEYSDKQYEEVGPYFSEYLDYVRESYGAEGFFTDLVAAAESNKIGDFASYRENGITYFSFGYYEGSDPSEASKLSYIDVSVYSNVSGAILALSFDADIYDSSLDHFTYDSSEKKFVIASNAVAGHLSYTVNQVIKARTFVNNINLDDFIYDSFDLYAQEQNEDGEYEYTKKVTSETTLEVYTKDTLMLEIHSSPDTGKNSLDPFTLSIVSGGDSDSLLGEYIKGYNGDNDHYDIECKKAGTYSVKVSTKKCEVTFTIKVNEIMPTGMKVYCYKSYIGYNYPSAIDEKTGFVNAYVNSPYYLEPVVEGLWGVSQEVTYEVKNLYGFKADESLYSIEEGLIVDEYDYENSRKAYVFTPKAAQVFLVTFYSKVDPSINKLIRITASDIDVGTDILSKEYTYSDWYNDTNYEFAFTPDTDAADTTGTAVVTATKTSMNADGDEETTVKTETVSYELEDSVFGKADFKFTHVSGEQGVVTQTDEDAESGINWMFIDNYDGIWLKLKSVDDFERLNVVIDPEAEISKKWSGSGEDSDGEDAGVDLEITFDKDDHTATGSISDDEDDDGEYSDAFTCTWVIEESDSGEGYSITLTKNEDDVDNGWDNLFTESTATAEVASDFSTITITTTGEDYEDYTFVMDSNF